MEHGTSAPNERVLRTTQLEKLSLNHPSVVLRADVFQYFYKIISKSRDGGIQTHGPTLVAFEGYH